MNTTAADSKETEAAGVQDDQNLENTMTAGKTRRISCFRLHEAE